MFVPAGAEREPVMFPVNVIIGGATIDVEGPTAKHVLEFGGERICERLRRSQEEFSGIHHRAGACGIKGEGRPASVVNVWNLGEYLGVVPYAYICGGSFPSVFDRQYHFEDLSLNWFASHIVDSNPSALILAELRDCSVQGFLGLKSVATSFYDCLLSFIGLSFGLNSKLVSIRASLLEFTESFLRCFSGTSGGIGTNFSNRSVNPIYDSGQRGENNQHSGKSHHPFIDRKLLISIRLFSGLGISLFAFHFIKSSVENRHSAFIVEYVVASLLVIIAHMCFFLAGWEFGLCLISQ